MLRVLCVGAFPCWFCIRLCVKSEVGILVYMIVFYAGVLWMFVGGVWCCFDFVCFVLC